MDEFNTAPGELLDVTPVGRSRREKLVAGLLLLATLASTTFAGMLQSLPAGLLANGSGEPLPALELFASHWQQGLPFSLVLLGILGAHELGHFFAARAHRVGTSLPFFIPAPTMFGTFGAVIQMRGRIWSRTALLDVGAAGPLVGFVLAVPAFALGLAWSTPVPAAAPAMEGAIRLRDSLLTAGLQALVVGPLPEGMDLVLHPVAFAAWIGLFVTALNLIPMGQLDGGHIAYALWPGRYRRIARLAWIGLLVAGAMGWSGWLFWALLGWLFGIDRHAPPWRMEPRLDAWRRREGLLAILVFALTFPPNPITIVLP